MGFRMKLWLVTRFDDERLNYEQTLGVVVRARDEQAARQTAALAAGDEGREPWLDPEQSTCEQLSESGAPEIILKDYWHG